MKVLSWIILLFASVVAYGQYPAITLFDSSGNPYPSGSGAALGGGAPGVTCYTIVSGSTVPCNFSGGGGSTAFSSITAGTNTSAAMVLGTGSSLTVSGSGTNTATGLTGTPNISVGTINTGSSGTITVGSGGNISMGANGTIFGSTGLFIRSGSASSLTLGSNATNTGCVLNSSTVFTCASIIQSGTVAATISGCGTAGSVTSSNGTTGSFTVGTGTTNCTFTVTLNGATGETASHGWVANADDTTANIHCVNSATVSSTTVVFVCTGTISTNDVIKWHADPY